MMVHTSIYLAKKINMKVICVSNIIECYGVSEVTKELEINNHYTVTDIWEDGVQRGVHPIELFFINGEYYPSNMFKLLDEVRNNKINTILE